MRKVSILCLSLVASFAVVGCDMFGGEKENSSVPNPNKAYCKATHTTKEACNADEKCVWKEGSDGWTVCKGKD